MAATFTLLHNCHVFNSLTCTLAQEDVVLFNFFTEVLSHLFETSTFFFSTATGMFLLLSRDIGESDPIQTDMFSKKQMSQLVAVNQSTVGSGGLKVDVTSTPQ